TVSCATQIDLMQFYLQNGVGTLYYDRVAAGDTRIGLATGSGGGGDVTNPTVSISSPSAGTILSGTTTVSASASDNVGGTGVAGVQFKLDGANLGAEDTSAPYSVSWDTTAASNA